jgi:hypothetical protein
MAGQRAPLRLAWASSAAHRGRPRAAPRLAGAVACAGEEKAKKNVGPNNVATFLQNINKK